MKAVILNCTLKYSPETSNTRALIDKVCDLYDELGVETQVERVTDYSIDFGITSDAVTDEDEWPELLEIIKTADILIIGSPIWFGVRSSVAQLVIERLDGMYMETDEKGQFPLYNTVGGVIVTGNEDGAHDVAANTLFNLSHLGCAIPPNADTYWVGDAGPGPSYIDAEGEKHQYTNKTARFLVHNTYKMAKLLDENPIDTDLKQLTEEAKAESE